MLGFTSKDILSSDKINENQFLLEGIKLKNLDKTLFYEFLYNFAYNLYVDVLCGEFKEDTSKLIIDGSLFTQLRNQTFFKGKDIHLNNIFLSITNALYLIIESDYFVNIDTAMLEAKKRLLSVMDSKGEDINPNEKQFKGTINGINVNVDSRAKSIISSIKKIIAWNYVTPVCEDMLGLELSTEKLSEIEDVLLYIVEFYISKPDSIFINHIKNRFLLSNTKSAEIINRLNANGHSVKEHTFLAGAKLKTYRDYKISGAFSHEGLNYGLEIKGVLNSNLNNLGLSDRRLYELQKTVWMWIGLNGEISEDKLNKLIDKYFENDKSLYLITNKEEVIFYFQNQLEKIENPSHISYKRKDKRK